MLNSILSQDQRNMLSPGKTRKKYKWKDVRNAIEILDSFRNCVKKKKKKLDFSNTTISKVYLWNMSWSSICNTVMLPKYISGNGKIKHTQEGYGVQKLWNSGSYEKTKAKKFAKAIEKSYKSKRKSINFTYW